MDKMWGAKQAKGILSTTHHKYRETPEASVRPCLPITTPCYCLGKGNVFETTIDKGGAGLKAGV